MSYTSQARQDAYDYLRILLSEKVIKRAVFNAEKAKIDRREARSVAYAEAKRAKREAEVLARREARKAETAKRRLDIAEAKKHLRLVKVIPAGLLREKYTTVGSEESSVREMWKMTNGSTARFIGGRVDETIDVGMRDRGYKAFRLNFTNYDGNDWKFELGDKFLILQPTPIEAVKLVQRFRDGINHCVFTPIINKLNAIIESSSDSSKKRLCQRRNNLTALSVVYADGVPESEMNEVAKQAGLKIVLHDVFGEKRATFNEKGGNVGSLHMTNTRENHVDIGLVVDSDATELEQDEMVEIWDSIKDANVFYMIDGNFRKGLPTQIRTLDGAWRIKNPMRDVCNKFDKELRIIDYKIDAIKYPGLNTFLHTGSIINSGSCALNDVEATGCADMPSAYTQFKKCHKYAGFLGHIHQFRSGVFSVDFVKEHLGYYQIIVRGGINWMFEKLGMCVGHSFVLFSPELLYFIENGLEVDIVQGAWGSRFDFDFPEYMMQPIITDGKKEKPYCHWSGRLGSQRNETYHTIPGSEIWASHLATEHKVDYWSDAGLITIKKPMKHSLTAHHILGGLTAYVRIQMMEAMKCFEPSQLVRVVLDGIYYRGEKPCELDWFNDKKVITSTGSAPWYKTEEVSKFPLMSEIVGNTLLTGQGGSGKTYSVFNDKGFNNVLFVSPSHILGQDVYEKYGAKYTTIHKLIGIPNGKTKCRPYYEDNRVPAVIFIDEITQIDASWIDKAFKMYPKSLILLAGDIDKDGRWYQCRSGNGNEWNTIWKPVGVQIIEYLEDRRSRDPEMKDIKLRARDVIKNCDLDYAIFQMQEWAENNLTTSKFDFVAGDTCIAGTHVTNKKLLAREVVSGYYKQGGDISDVQKDGYDKRGSFTIHSYQGKTIESGNIWICIDDLFEHTMLYTAISRGVNFSQLKFFRSRDLV
jgi:hypothetical protein